MFLFTEKGKKEIGSGLNLLNNKVGRILFIYRKNSTKKTRKTKQKMHVQRTAI